MTKRLMFASVIALLAIVGGVTGEAKAGEKTKTEHLAIAGTFLTSRMDANSDGDAASWCTSQVKGGTKGKARCSVLTKMST